MFAEEFFPERVTNEVEGVGSNISEDFVGKFGVSYEDDEVSDDVINREA